MNITLDLDRCCGAGMCALTAPEVFGQDDDGFPYLLTSSPALELTDLVRTTATLCPAGVIKLS